MASKQQLLLADGSAKTKKKPRGKPFEKGVSGNPSGGPSHGESWSGLIKKIGNMRPSEVAGYLKDLSSKFTKMGDELTLKEIVVLRAFATLALETNASILNALMDRGEGKVPNTIAPLGGSAEAISWRDFVLGVQAMDAQMKDEEEAIDGVVNA